MEIEHRRSRPVALGRYSDQSGCGWIPPESLDVGALFQSKILSLIHIPSKGLILCSTGLVYEQERVGRGLAGDAVQ